MAFSLSKQQIASLKDRAESMIKRAKSITEKSEEAIGQVVQSVEINGAAFGAGLVKGRFGTIEILGVPADLGAFAAGHLLGFFGGGKYKEHIHNLSDGVGASYFTSLGAGIGQRMARDAAAGGAGTPATRTTTAAGGLGDGERLSDQEHRILVEHGLRVAR